jgi:hypothetical protein
MGYTETKVNDVLLEDLARKAVDVLMWLPRDTGGLSWYRLTAEIRWSDWILPLKVSNGSSNICSST